MSAFKILTLASLLVLTTIPCAAQGSDAGAGATGSACSSINPCPPVASPGVINGGRGSGGLSTGASGGSTFGGGSSTGSGRGGSSGVSDQTCAADHPCLLGQACNPAGQCEPMTCTVTNNICPSDHECVDGRCLPRGSASLQTAVVSGGTVTTGTNTGPTNTGPSFRAYMGLLISLAIFLISFAIFCEAERVHRSIIKRRRIKNMQSLGPFMAGIYILVIAVSYAFLILNPRFHDLDYMPLEYAIRYFPERFTPLLLLCSLGPSVLAGVRFAMIKSLMGDPTNRTSLPFKGPFGLVYGFIVATTTTIVTLLSLLGNMIDFMGKITHVIFN